MSGIDKIIDWLSASGTDYRKTSDDSYMACCPAHTDKSPSLSIKGLPDGRVLMHCFAGCPWDEILFVMDMEPADIMPPDNNYRPVKNAAKAAEKRFIRDVESLVISSKVARGERLSESEKQAVIQARIAESSSHSKAPWEA